MRPLLHGAGHDVFTPALTGLGERAHLARPDIDLDTHIQDVVGVVEYEDLHEVVLVGHSYGGVVITGAADRLVGRVARLVYLDAEVPEDGQSGPLHRATWSGRGPTAWIYRELATGHAPHVTAPRQLTDLLLALSVAQS